MDQSFEKLQNKFLEKKKFRIFFIFIILSLSFWIITKLSNTYNETIFFKAVLTDIPDFILPEDIEELTFSADINASGFQLLLYNFLNDEINISATDGDFSSDIAQVDLLEQRFYIQQQLFQNTILNQLQPSILTFAFDQLKRKRVPVYAVTEIDYKLGYERAEDWKIYPDSIWVAGPSNIIDTLNNYPTKTIQKKKVEKKISELVSLKSIQGLKPAVKEVKVTADVNKFTEKTLEVFVNIRNLPDSLIIKLFPQSVKTTFLALIDSVEGIGSSDFLFYCDFEDTQSGELNSLEVKLIDQPDGVRNVRWEPKKLDYLIRQ